MYIYDMKLNHMVRPLGFAMKETVFTWKVGEALGTVQTAARIVVYADPEKITILADTGWRADLNSLAARVDVELQPRTRYYWQVSVRTDAAAPPDPECAGGSGAQEEATSDLEWFETGKMDESWRGQWVTCDSAEKRHPYFEKEIAQESGHGAPARARLYVCGLGLYEAFWNGQRIGEEYLTPYSNDYNQWIQAQTFDVTGPVNGKADGTLSILLGNGWYKARFGYSATEDVGFYGQDWKLIAELVLTYEDGTERVIGTDDSWNVRRSNLTFSNIYDGEHRDDTLGALPPVKAQLTEAPKGRLMDRLSVPVTIHKVMEPAELILTPAGEQVLDMGQEFTGLFSLRVHEPAGTVIHIQTGEILQQGNFYRDNLRTAKSEYYYTSNGEETILVPHFTFYGYRYVKIEGISDLKKEDFKGLALWSEVSDRGSITTGHALVNQFLSNVRWGLRSNFVDVPTDCPQRDERMGWTGDAQAFAPTASYLTDSYAFYQKYLYDMYQEQLEHDGMVPDVVPSAVVNSTACVWGDASCIIPWTLYVFYGDKTILEHQYAGMKAWVDYVRRIDGEDHGWRRHFHYGDWLALDYPEPGPEQVLGATDEEFIANLYYAASAQLVAKAAGVLDLAEDEEEYRKLSEEQFRIVKDEYYSKTGRCCIKTQTALLLTLKYHLSVNEQLAKDQLMKLFEQSKHKLKTGFVGTPILCNVLSDNGFSALAYELLLNEEFPGWLREVKLGATTVWERWNSLLDDGTISGTSMNSMNHYAYGSVAEWVFRHAAGINVTEEGIGAGYSGLGGRTMVLAPEVNWKLRSLDAVYDSPAGEWKVSWDLPDAHHIHLKVTVPFGCRARLILPNYSADENAAKGGILPGADNAAPSDPSRADDPAAGIYDLAPGEYEYSYETDQPLKVIYSTDTPIRTLLSNPDVVRVLSRFMDLSQVPGHMQDMSIRQMAAVYGGRMSEEQLAGLDAVLAAI